NARDHTMAAAYSVRGVPEATVSTPVTWDEIDDVEPLDCTIATVPRRFAELGDLHGGIDDAVFALDELLAWAERDEREGAVDAGEPEDSADPDGSDGPHDPADPTKWLARVPGSSQFAPRAPPLPEPRGTAGSS